MSDVLRGKTNAFGVSSDTQADLRLQLKRQKPKNIQNIPELVAKFGELKRKMLDLAQENQSLKDQLLRAHETNSLLAQENSTLKLKHTEVLDVESTINQSIEDLLIATTRLVEEEIPTSVSKIPRPVGFSIAKINSTAPEVPIKRVEPTMKTEVKVKQQVVMPVAKVVEESKIQKTQEEAIAVEIPKEHIPNLEDLRKKSVPKKVENIPSPFEVVDLTLVKKSEPISSSQTAQAVQVLEKPAVKKIVEVVPAKNIFEAKPFGAIKAPNILEENKATRIRQEKPKTKLEAVNDALLQDIKTYLLKTDALPLEDKKVMVADFLNLNIMPKPAVSATAQTPKGIVGDKVAKLVHLTETEKSRLYNDLNSTPDDFLIKNLTEVGVLYL